MVVTNMDVAGTDDFLSCVFGFVLNSFKYVVIIFIVVNVLKLFLSLYPFYLLSKCCD